MKMSSMRSLRVVGQNNVTVVGVILVGLIAGFPSNANAALVSVTGATNLAQTGNGMVLTPGSNGVFASTFTPFTVSTPDLTVSGTVRARSTVRDSGSGLLEQTMDLSWQELRVTTSALTEINFSVNLSQAFEVGAPFLGQTASFNSFSSYTNVTFGASNQLASWQRTRSDGGAVSDVTIARTRTSTGSQSVLFDGLSGFGSSQAAIGAIYTMTMSINFVLSPQGKLLTFTDTGGPTDVTLVMVPLPGAAWAGMGGLALVGAVVARRRLRVA